MEGLRLTTIRCQNGVIESRTGKVGGQLDDVYGIELASTVAHLRWIRDGWDGDAVILSEGPLETGAVTGEVRDVSVAYTDTIDTWQLLWGDARDDGDGWALRDESRIEAFAVPLLDGRAPERIGFREYVAPDPQSGAAVVVANRMLGLVPGGSRA